MQSDWTHLILSHLNKNDPLVLVADPDSLLQEESVQRALRERGYESMEYEDAMVARYLYEKTWRARLKSGGKLLVLLSSDDFRAFPYDWLSRAQRVSLKLTTLFPNLSYPVLRGIPQSYLPPLVAPSQALRRPLGDNETRRFVLKHALEFAPEAIVSTGGLIHQLILVYLQHPSIPDDLLSAAGNQLDWLEPPKILFAGRTQFFNYLQRAWEDFIKTGESSVPFESVPIRYLLPNLFAEGIMRRSEANDVKLSWATVGVVKTNQSVVDRVLADLEAVEFQIPGPGAHHAQWGAFAVRWGEVTAQAIRTEPSHRIDTQFLRLQEKIDTEFWAWLEQHYGLLLSLSPLPTPVTVNKIAAYLESHVAEKVALLVLDGLSMVAWHLLRSEWEQRGVEMECTVSGCLAMIPTLTNISRQSIFSGQLPVAFPKYLDTTYHEPNHWKRFWAKRQSVVYDKGNLSDIAQRLSDTTYNLTASVVGLVINDIDDIADAEVQGVRGLAASLTHWARTAQFETVIEKLLAAGYHVVVTADHGHTAATGVGTLSEGLVVEKTGHRARLYASENLRPAHPHGRPWEGRGLPNDRFALLAAGYTAFGASGKTVVTHGGASIEEVIVPFIRCHKRQ